MQLRLALWVAEWPAWRNQRASSFSWVSPKPRPLTGSLDYASSGFDVIGNENESDAMLDRVSNAIANSHTILLESEQTLRNNHELR